MDFSSQDTLGFGIMGLKFHKKHTLFFLCSMALVSALLSNASPARAERPLAGTLPTMNPRTLALGSTLRASPSGTAGVYQNPAVLAMSPVYHMEAMYQYTGNESKHNTGTVIADSVTTVVAAGLAFNFSTINQKRTKYQAYDGRLAIAGAIGNMFFLGVTARYLYVDAKWNADKWGPGGMPALPSSDSKNVNAFTFDAGAALRFGNVISLGVVGYNLIPTESAFAPLKLGAGASVHILNMLMVEVNTVVDFSSHDEDIGNDIELGAELFLGGVVALRAGYIYDFYYELHQISAGLGYVHSKFAIDFGYMQELVDDGRWNIAFGIKYFIN